MVVERSYLQHLTTLWALGEKGTGLPIVTIQLAGVAPRAAPATKHAIAIREGISLSTRLSLNTTLRSHLWRCLFSGLGVGCGSLA